MFDAPLRGLLRINVDPVDDNGMRAMFTTNVQLNQFVASEAVAYALNQSLPIEASDRGTWYSQGNFNSTLNTAGIIPVTLVLHSVGNPQDFVSPESNHVMALTITGISCFRATVGGHIIQSTFNFSNDRVNDAITLLMNLPQDPRVQGLDLPCLISDVIDRLGEHDPIVSVLWFRAQMDALSVAGM